jgi:hypothetical protein
MGHGSLQQKQKLSKRTVMLSHSFRTKRGMNGARKFAAKAKTFQTNGHAFPLIPHKTRNEWGTEVFI